MHNQVLVDSKVKITRSKQAVLQMSVLLLQLMFTVQTLVIRGQSLARKVKP